MLNFYWLVIVVYCFRIKKYVWEYVREVFRKVFFRKGFFLGGFCVVFLGFWVLWWVDYEWVDLDFCWGRVLRVIVIRGLCLVSL